MLFQHQVRKLLQAWMPEVDGKLHLLEKLSVIQAFYHDRREELIILVIDALETNDDWKLPQVLGLLDKEVNAWFRMERDFTFSEVLIDELL